MYSNLLQNCRGGYTLKKKFSSSRCPRDKEIFLWGYTTGGTPSKNVLVVSLPTRQRDISLRVNYFCRLIVSGTKITYNKSLPVNFVRMFKINTRKLWQIKINKQWVINTNKRKYRFFGSVNPSQHLFLMCYCTAIYM